MRAISLFSGAGGMDAGFERAGFRTSLACEMDRHAAATWQANFGGRMHQGDVRGLVSTLEEGMAAAVFGGPPCQGYSVAGKMDPGDPRSGLVFDFMEAVSRVRPSVFVMENVDALARLAKWRGTLNDIIGTAHATGYATCVRVLDAADYGVPQSRKRMFIWGSRMLSPESLEAAVERSLASSRTARLPARSVFDRLGREGTKRNPKTSNAVITFCRNPVLRASPYAGMLFNGAGRPIDPDRPAPAMSASAGGNKTHVVDERHVFEAGPSFAAAYRSELEAGAAPRTGRAPEYLRRLTVAEAAAFQTFPHAFRFSGPTSSAYRQIGNAVPCLLAGAVGAAAAATLADAGAVAA